MAGNNFDHILDECLEMIQNGQTTLDDCLIKYPQHAANLRPLLEMVQKIETIPVPIASQAVFQAGKQRMLAALAEKRQNQAKSPSISFRFPKQKLRFINNIKIPTKRIIVLPLAALATVLFFFFGGNFLFQPEPIILTSQTASLTDVIGVVNVQAAGSSNWEPAANNMILMIGDNVSTGDFSSVTLTFFDGSQTALFPDTALSISEMSTQEDGSNKIIILHQWWGRTRNRVMRLLDPGSHFEIKTPTAVTAVRGTDYLIDVAEDGTSLVNVLEGAVDVTAQGITVEVGSGQTTTVHPGEPPTPVGPNEILPSPSPTLVDTDDDDGDDDDDGNDDDDGDDGDGDDDGDDGDGDDDGDDGDGDDDDDDCDDDNDDDATPTPIATDDDDDDDDPDDD